MAVMRSSGSCRYLGIAALTFLVLAVATVLLPHDPYIRYQSLKGTMFSRTSWIYERIHFDPTPIDIAFIGSSRTGAAVDPPRLEADLAARGRPLHVVNLSLPAAGMDIRLAEAAELLNSDKKVRLIVLDLPEALPRDGHQAFGELATASEVLSSPWAINRNLPENLFRLPLRQIRLALASRFPQAFDYQAGFDATHYLGSAVSPAQFRDWQAPEAQAPLGSPEHAAALKAEAVTRRREIRPPVLPASLAWAEFGVSRSYLRQISDLAEKKGTKVVFLFLPFYDGYDAPADADWSAQIAPIWNASFLKNDPRNFRDAAHGSDHMLPLISEWLAGQITAYLPPEN